MFGSGILETAIGLIFVFLLVSILVTITNEMVAALLSSRARSLKRGLGRLVGDEWMRKLYAHPLISGSAVKEPPSILNRGPAYIPSRSFANVLMSLVQENAVDIAACQVALRKALDAASGAGATIETLKQQLAGTAAVLQKPGGLQATVAGDFLRHMEAPPVPNTRTWLAEVDARVRELRAAGRPELAPLLTALAQLVANGVNATASVDQLRTGFSATVESLLTGPATMALKEELMAMGKRLQGPYSVADAYADLHWFIDGMSARYVRQGLGALPECDLRRTLLTLCDDAGSDLEKLKENIEVWFNSGMDRVNGWYKRRTQVAVTVFALALTVAMNVDAIRIFRHLDTYSGARDAIVAQATQYVKKNPPATAQTGAAPIATAAAPESPPSLQDLQGQFAAARTNLQNLALPIGWVEKGTQAETDNGQVFPDTRADAWPLLRMHALGWILTALAASLGAPFWFDMLNRVVSIRATGKPPGEEPKPPNSVSVPVEPGQSPREADRIRQRDGRNR